MTVIAPRRHLNFAVLLLAIGLHIASIAAVHYVFLHTSDKPAEMQPLTVRLAPDAQPSSALQSEAPAAAMNAPSTLPLSKKQTTPKPTTTAKVHVPAVKTDLTPAPTVNMPEVQPDQKTMPEHVRAALSTTTESAVPGTAPAAAIKTGVTIPASYALSNRKPDYPTLSRRFGEQGTTVLRVLVQTDGSAGEVQITKSSGYALLDASARTAMRSWRFHPATSDGKAIAEWYQISIPFTLQN